MPGSAHMTKRRFEMEERQRMFLEALRRTGEEAAGLEAAGVSDQTIRRWRRKEDAFREAFNEAAKGPGAAQETGRSFRGRKRVFLDVFERTGVLAAALRPVEATMKELREWLRGDAAFRETYMETKARFRARAGEETERRIAAGEPVSEAGRKRVFLKQVREVGTTTGGCEAAGVSLKTLNGWLEEDGKFAEEFEEAKQRFRDHIEEAIVHRIKEGKNVGLLQFKAQAELPEKYGKGKKEAAPKEQGGLTWEDIERAAREPYDVGEC